MKTLLLFLSVFIPSTVVRAFHLPFHGTVSYTDIIHEINTGQIKKIVVANDLKETTLIEKSGHVEKISMEPIITTEIMKKAVDNHVEIGYMNKFRLPGWLMSSFGYAPLVFLGWVLFQRISPNFRQYEYDVINVQNTTFSDWGGSREVMRECQETIQYFLQPHELVKKPKGVLLEGPPGTGKTLLGRILANYADATFIAFSASNFVELYAGMGALRVRKLFEYARKNSPCIIFIDEIDAIGQRRRQNVMGNEEREQTLNQLLYEMDGFRQNEDILVVAATNRKDILDEALLRPGRFDRIVHIPLPDKTSRRDIIKIFIKNRFVDKDVDWGFFASQTEGFSGADIGQWISDASIVSLRSNETVLTHDSLWGALERMRVGVKKEHDMRSELIRKRVAVHEAGHALICLCFPDYFMFQKITIQETYHGVGGYTMYNVIPDFAETSMITKDLLMKQIQLLLGGRVAESVFYGDPYVSIGAHDDLNKANELCRQMVTQFGMGGKLNNVVSPSEDSVSDQFLTMTDQDTVALLRSAMYDTRQLVSKHRDFIDALAQELLFEPSMSQKEVKKLWSTYNKKPFLF
jgi:cell division protease FtsH